MTIRKLEFYEGAALHQLARSGEVVRLQHDPPFFLVNDSLLVHLKYSTKGRSPWGFTFTRDEQALLAQRASKRPLMIGLICGADGIAALSYPCYHGIASLREAGLHIACYRKHGQHYSIAGPDGELANKVSPSHWQRLLEKTKDETL